MQVSVAMPDGDASDGCHPETGFDLLGSTPTLRAPSGPYGSWPGGTGAVTVTDAETEGMRSFWSYVVVAAAVIIGGLAGLVIPGLAVGVGIAIGAGGASQ